MESEGDREKVKRRRKLSAPETRYDTITFNAIVIIIIVKHTNTIKIISKF